MKHLDLKTQCIFCDKYKITFDALILLEILLVCQEDDDPEIVNLYFSSSNKNNLKYNLTHLQTAGLINSPYRIPEKGENFNPLKVPLNKNIVKDFYKCSFELGNELWDIYPQFTTINGAVVGIRSISKKFDTPEDAFRYYGKVIRWKPDIHKHIIELIEWGKEHNVICCSLANFIVDRKWEELEALKNGDLANVNYDAVKLV